MSAQLKGILTTVLAVLILSPDAVLGGTVILTVLFLYSLPEKSKYGELSAPNHR